MRETNCATRFHAVGFHRYGDGYDPHVLNTNCRTCVGRSSERVYGDAMQEMVPAYLERSVETLTREREKQRR